MTHETYVFTEEPRGERYETLLRLGLELCTTFGVVLHRFRSTPPGIARVIGQLEPYVVERKEVVEWPGTRLGPGYTADLHLYSFVPPVLRILVGAASGLYEWKNTELPDDPHLLRADGSTWLGCIAHEEYAWLELTSVEHDQLQAVAPSVASILSKEP